MRTYAEKINNRRLVAIILTFNEERHIRRAIESVSSVADRVVVVDSFSTDTTVQIAKECGAEILVHPFINQSKQFNWALTRIGGDVSWILRIDADEVLSSQLASEIQCVLSDVDCSIVGFFVNRRMKFLGKLIKYGGIFPTKSLRLFRYGSGMCEDRWMDEHIKVSGPALKLKGDIIDDNLQSLTWWTTKHNSYASREAVDLLNLKYRFMPHDSVADLSLGNQVGVKRWLKESVYAKLPGGLRAFAYFFYRYVLRLGFLDGSTGTAFHFLQGFWYRFLVDSKVAEVERYIKTQSVDVKVAIREVLGINV